MRSNPAINWTPGRLRSAVLWNVGMGSSLVLCPPPHDFLGHIVGAYCLSVMEVFMESSKTERGQFPLREKMDMTLCGDELDLALPEEGFVHAGLHRTQGSVRL